MMEFDHIAVAGPTLAAATAHAETALGVTLQAGGEHAVYGTHNTLLGLQGGLYLEAIAINPAAKPQQKPRWFGLDAFTGAARLSNWICRCNDLDATLAGLPDGYGAPVSLTRGDLKWRMAVPADGMLPFNNCAPALIEWEGTAHPAAMLATSDAQLLSLTITHPGALDLRDMLAPLLTDARIRFEIGTAALVAAFDVAGHARELS